MKPRQNGAGGRPGQDGRRPLSRAEQYWRGRRRRKDFHRGVWIGIGLMGLACAFGAVALTSPVVMLGGAFAVLFVVGIFARPDMATPVVIFALYSNAVVVATRFHGVPKIAAAVFPLVLAVPLIHHLVLRREGLVTDTVFSLLLLFLVVQIIGMLFSSDVEISAENVLEMVLEGLTIYLLVINAVRTSKSLRVATWALVLSGLLMGAIPLYQQVTKNFKNDFGGFGQTTEIGFRTGEVSSEGEVRQVRLCGPIGEQNRYAQNLLMILPLGFFLHGNSRSKGLRLLALACTGFTFAGLVLSFSRGAAVALMLLVGIAMFLRLIKTRQIIFALLAAAALLVVMPQYLLRLSSIGSIRGFFEDDVGAADEPDGAIKGRVTEMLAAAQVFLDYPVVGVGPGMFKYYSQDYGNKLGIRRLKQTRQAHSLYLDLAAENGALGLLTFSGVIFFSLSRLARVRRRWAGVRPDLSNAATAYMLAVIAYLATGIFLHMSYVRFFYLVLALASAASRAGEIEENAAGAPEAPRPDPLVAAPSPRMLEKLA